MIRKSVDRSASKGWYEKVLDATLPPLVALSEAEGNLRSLFQMDGRLRHASEETRNNEERNC